MSQSEHLGEQSKERHRQFLLLCATYALLASPFYVFASPRSGTANAVAHIAVGFLVVCLPYKLRPAIFSGRISAYLRRPAIACGFLVAIPYYFFEISSLGWLFAPRSETPLGFWSAPFADVFSFMGSALGYWPLCISAAFLGIAWILAKEYSPIASSGSATEDIPNEGPRTIPANLAPLFAAFFAGILRKPLCPIIGQEAHIAGLLIASTLLLGVAMAVYISTDSRGPVDVLISHSVGVILLNVTARITPLPLVSSVEFAALLCALALALSALLLSKAKLMRPAAVNECTQNDFQVAALKKRDASSLAGYTDLTPSERACVDLLAKKKSTAEVAAELGKSPSTVRVLLGRSYKKLNVASAAELDALLSSFKEESLPEKESSLIGNRRVAWAVSARAAILLLVALPLAPYPCVWGLGREIYLPLGVGLFSAGTIRLICPVRAFARAAVLRSIPLALGSLCCLLKLPFLQPSAGQPLAIALPLCTFAFGFMTVLLQEAPNEKSSLRPIDFAPLFIALCIGAIAEELWRDLGFFSILPQLFPLFLAITAGAILVLGRENHVFAAFACLAGMSAIVFAGLDRGGAFACCFLCAAAAVRLVTHFRMLDTSVPHIAPAFGLGIIAADVVVGTFADRLSFNDVALRYLGGQTGLLALGGFALGIAFCAMGAATIAYCLHLLNDVSAVELGLTAGEDSRTRVLGYLASQGLSETEAAVLYKIAEGMSGSEISEALNYSIGTINSLRSSGYVKLHIHSRRELISCISAGTKLVN